MPRTALTTTAAPSKWSTTGVALTQAAADVGNGNQFTSSGNDLLIVQNTGGSPYTVTISSVPDALGRTGDVTTQSLAAGEIRVFWLPALGWQQADGKIYVSASNAAVKFGIVVL